MRESEPARLSAGNDSAASRRRTSLIAMPSHSPCKPPDQSTLHLAAIELFVRARLQPLPRIGSRPNGDRTFWCSWRRPDHAMPATTVPGQLILARKHLEAAPNLCSGARTKRVVCSSGAVRAWPGLAWREEITRWPTRPAKARSWWDKRVSRFLAACAFSQAHYSCLLRFRGCYDSLRRTGIDFDNLKRLRALFEGR